MGECKKYGARAAAESYEAILNRIGLAASGRELLDLQENVIPRLVLLKEERAALQAAIAGRFGALNAAAVGSQVQRKPGHCLPQIKKEL